MTPCQKKVFFSKKEAKKRGKEILQKSRVKMEIYFCDKCLGYHFTSMSRSQSRKVGKQLNKNK